MEKDLEQTTRRIVDQEVLCCVSHLVSTLAEGYGEPITAKPLREFCEQAWELSTPVADYEEAAIQEGWKHGGDGDGFWYNSKEFESWKVALSDDGATTYEDAEELCRAEDIEPYDREVFEHWAVSNWLADKLEAAGEKVDRDFANLNVWARTTSGQGIAQDYVIGKIVKALQDV